MKQMKQTILAAVLLTAFGSAMACPGGNCAAVTPAVTGNVTSFSGANVSSSSTVAGTGAAAHYATAFAENCTTVSANGTGSVGKFGGLAGVATTANTVGISGATAGGVGNGSATAAASQYGAGQVDATFKYNNVNIPFVGQLPGYDVKVGSSVALGSNATANVVGTGFDAGLSGGAASNAANAVGGHGLNVATTGVTVIGADGVFAVGDVTNTAGSAQAGYANITVGNSVKIGNGDCKSVANCK